MQPALANLIAPFIENQLQPNECLLKGSNGGRVSLIVHDKTIREGGQQAAYTFPFSEREAQYNDTGMLKAVVGLRLKAFRNWADENLPVSKVG